MRPSSMRSRTSVISIAQPTGAQALVVGPHDPELRAALQALADHRAIALLEDVQRDELVGERDDAEREEREVAHDAVGHPASSLWVPSARPGCIPAMEELDAYERRFRRAGLPLLIEGWSAREDALPRAFPLLAFVFLGELLGALNLTWSPLANVGGAGGRARRSCSAPWRSPTGSAGGALTALPRDLGALGAPLFVRRCRRCCRCSSAARRRARWSQPAPTSCSWRWPPSASASALLADPHLGAAARRRAAREVAAAARARRPAAAALRRRPLPDDGDVADLRRDRRRRR